MLAVVVEDDSFYACLQVGKNKDFVDCALGLTRVMKIMTDPPSFPTACKVTNAIGGCCFGSGTGARCIKCTKNSFLAMNAASGSGPRQAAP